MRIAINIISSYTRFLLGMAAVFFLTPFILTRIGAEDFGLWSLCLAVTGVLGVLDLGFSTAAVKYVAECAGNGRHEARNEALSTLLAVYTLLGIIIFALVLSAIPAGIHWFGLDSVEAARFRTIITITGIAQGIALPLSLFRSALVGQGRYDVVNSFDIGIIAFNIILVTTLLSSGLGLLGLALANASIVLAGPLALVPVAFRKIPGLALSVGRIRLARLREAAPLAVWFMLANIALIITLRSDALLIKIYLPLSAVAAFAIAAKISESSYLLNKQFSNALMPLISNSRGAGDSAKVRAILQDGTRYLAAIAAPVLGLLFFHAERVIDLWVGPEMRDAVLPLRILLVAVFFSTLQFNAANVLGMSGGHRGVAWTVLGSAMLNILLSIIFIPRLGLAGAALATLVSAMTLEFGVMLKRTCNHQAVTLTSVLLPILPVFLSLTPMVLAAHWLNLHWPISSLPVLALQCVVAGIIFLAVASMVVISKDERRRVIRGLTGLYSKRSKKRMPAPVAARQE
jgi:O-antigen/teichoic acid export membrane protein